MKHRLVPAVLLIAAASLTAAAPAETPAASARRFVDRLYGLAGPPVPESRLYAPALARLVDRAQRIAAVTEDPDLVGDPLCDCQDMSEFRVRITLISATAEAAAARVTLTGGVDGPRRFLLKLARAADGWRLADSIAEPGGSYAANLRRDIAGR